MIELFLYFFIMLPVVILNVAVVNFNVAMILNVAVVNFNVAMEHLIKNFLSDVALAAP